MALPIFSKRLSPVRTPAGAAPGAPGNVGATKKVNAYFSFAVDGANAPVAGSNLGDPFSVTRVSQGLYRIKMGGATALAGGYGVKKFLAVIPSLQTATVGKLVAELAALDAANGIIDVHVVDKNAGAVADPAAAGANERINVIASFDDGAP